MTIRRIINTLAFLVFDDLFLIVDNVLIDGFNEPAKFVRFRPDDFFQRVFRHGLEILGHIIGREAIGAFAANARVHFVQPAIAKVFRIEEKQMLK